MLKNFHFGIQFHYLKILYICICVNYTNEVVNFCNSTIHQRNRL